MEDGLYVGWEESAHGRRRYATGEERRQERKKAARHATTPRAPLTPLAPPGDALRSDGIVALRGPGG